MKEISGCGKLLGGTERSCQVAPRSIDRNRRGPSTSAQTTLAEGALNNACVGWLTGVGGVTRASGTFLVAEAHAVVMAATRVTEMLNAVHLRQRTSSITGKGGGSFCQVGGSMEIRESS